MIEQNFAGKDGMFWFLGVVEDRMDPLHLGRVKVRCFGYHTSNKIEIKTKDLPWALISDPTTSAANSGVGSTSGLVEGSLVWGFFLDGSEGQEPLIVGSIKGLPTTVANPNKGFNDPRTSRDGYPKVISAVDYNSDGSGSSFTDAAQPAYPRSTVEPDASRLARNDADFPSVVNTRKTEARSAGMTSIPVAGGGTFNEPASAYNAAAPFNKVYESESGHAIEVDDTPGAERIHVYHRSGSFIEMRPDGSVVIKSVNDVFELAHRNAYENVLGEKVTTLNKSLKLKVMDNLVVEVTEGNAQVDVLAGNAVINVDGNTELTVGGDVTLDVTGNLDATVGGDITAECTNADITADAVTVTAPTSTFNGDLVVTGSITAPVGLIAAVTSTTTATVTLTINGFSLPAQHRHNETGITTGYQIP